MNASLLSWLAVGLGVLLSVVLLVMQRAARRTPRDKGLRETQMVALVRRRRELSSQLADLAGDQGRQLLQAEARRLRGSVTDISVLEAAVARAERLSERAQLSASVPEG